MILPAAQADIHPLAVIIARTTYLLAICLPVKVSKRPIQFSLGEVPGYEVRFGGNRKVSIPEVLVKRPEFFDPAIAAAARIAMDHAGSGKESRKSMEAYLQKVVPTLTAHTAAGSMIDAIWKFTTELTDLIKHKQNSIWAFIIPNSYRPAMLRERFDFIVGNPPWLSYRYIADSEYQAEIKKRAVED